jgi:hypothetical protein
MMIELNDILTALSVITAAIIGLIALRQTQQTSRHAHTFEVLMSRFTGDYVANLHSNAWEWMNSGKPSPTGEKIEQQIVEILNMYEFIALAARRKILDPSIIYDMRATNTIRLYDYFLPYIRGRRKMLGKDSIYEHFEWFVVFYAKPRRDGKR